MTLYSLLLAGGKSSRMGQDKRFLVFQGQTLVERSLALLQNTGSDQLLISGELAGYKSIPDLLPDSGPLGGLHAALHHRSAHHAAHHAHAAHHEDTLGSSLPCGHAVPVLPSWGTHRHSLQTERGLARASLSVQPWPSEESPRPQTRLFNSEPRR